MIHVVGEQNILSFLIGELLYNLHLGKVGIEGNTNQIKFTLQIKRCIKKINCVTY